jgi:hypothetical protein
MPTVGKHHALAEDPPHLQRPRRLGHAFGGGEGGQLDKSYAVLEVFRQVGRRL